MSNKTLSILAATLIVAAFFANRDGISGYNSPTKATTNQYYDSLVQQHIIATYNQRIVRTVRCHVGVGTPPSFITKQVNTLYEQREQACQAAAIKE